MIIMVEINKNCKMIKKVFLFGLMIVVFGCKNEVISVDSISKKLEKKDTDDSKFPKVKDLSQYPKTEFITTLESKINNNNNNVYCVTMLYAWNEIKNKINQPFQIDSNFKHLTLLNYSTSFKDVLNTDEYIISSEIDGQNIRAKAKFNKYLPFQTELNGYKDRLKFNNEKVLSFGITGYDSHDKLKIVSILYYKNDNNFVIKLHPKDTNHEIILFKSEKKFDKMSDINSEIIKLTIQGKEDKQNENINWKYGILEEDEIIIPKFNFNIETIYKDLAGNTFNVKDQSYIIEKAWQRTAFILDEKGAEVESEAEFAVATEEMAEEVNKPKPKKMIFDKPFFIMLKKTKSQNPYFGLWVANTELMSKK